jgi:hypothetical protein
MTTPDSHQNSGPFDFFLIQENLNDVNGLQTEWLFSSDFPVTDGFYPLSPDSRYLMFNQRGMPVYFHDLETGSAVPFDLSLGWMVDWSPDGRFYVQWSDEGLTLTEPATDFQAKLSYDLSTCIGFEWIVDE